MTLFGRSVVKKPLPPPPDTGDDDERPVFTFALTYAEACIGCGETIQVGEVGVTRNVAFGPMTVPRPCWHLACWQARE